VTATRREAIRKLALDLINARPSGLHYSELVRLVHQAHPEIPINTMTATCGTWKPCCQTPCTSRPAASFARSGFARRRARNLRPLTASVAANVNQLSRWQILESAKQGRYEGSERFDPVRGGDEDHHGDWEGTEVLLMFEILIRCQEGVEVASCQPQQRAVSDALPAYRRDRADLMLGQQPGERPRQRFIEEDAHRRSAGLWRVREQRPPAHASRWGSRRGTDPRCPRRQGSRGGFSRALGFRGKRGFRPGSPGPSARQNPTSPCRSSYTRIGEVPTGGVGIWDASNCRPGVVRDRRSHTPSHAGPRVSLGVGQTGGTAHDDREWRARRPRPRQCP